MEFKMIRPITRDDTNAVMTLADATGLFQPNELEVLGEVLADYLGGDPDRDHFWLADDEGGLVGTAYCVPEPMAYGIWNLLFIAVRPDLQGQGHGSALLLYVEQALRERGVRLLLVETSGLGTFEQTRAFYRKHGYDEEARIRDYYRAGDDKVIFRKALTA